MKIAVLGQGPVSVHYALHFHALGADVTIFKRDSFGGNLHLLLTHYPDYELNGTFFELTTEIGRSFVSLSSEELQKKPTIKEYWEKYFAPMVEKSELFSIAKTAEVNRVHKRFLNANEIIAGKSRMHDLFRVVYSLDPKESILKQVKENPEAFDKLGEDVLNSLHESVEGFADFDIVIDCRGEFNFPNPMGASNSYALNEPRLNKENVFYGKEFLKQNPNLLEVRNIVLVGSGDTIALSLIALEDWFKKVLNGKIYLFCDEMKPFESITHKWLQKKLKYFFDVTTKEYEDLVNNYQRKVFEYRSLPDFEKTKNPPPTEPVNRFEIYNGYSVTALDKLIDRNGVFITAEFANFRDPKVQDEIIKTVAADVVIVGKSYAQKAIDQVNQGLSQKDSCEEPGYFKINHRKLDECLMNIEKVEKNILSFFSRQS